ncbi:hypothetical protein ElyMa_005369400 [Elysia marginata]|uniref:Uncharacterized protein n=1 Tax=Elysia marginata TaxID=1093978 RepID=A0AAV4EDB5_9GAST|nr:hypothetical protein ElyMa_005369400 [Elysia marginata]
MVRNDVFWYTKSRNPVVEKSRSACRSMGARKRNSLGPSRETVDDNKKIGVFLVGVSQDPHEDCETYQKLALNKRGTCMTVDIRGLAIGTFLAPPANVMLHSIPYKALCYRLLSYTFRPRSKKMSPRV